MFSKLFTNIIEKPVYIDTLHEWRKVDVLGFKLLDKVWIIRTMTDSEYTHPHCRYNREVRTNVPQEWIIIWMLRSIFYTNVPIWQEIDYDWWFCKQIDWTYNQYQWNIKYENTWYRVLLRNWDIIEAHTIKKSHWEFQEEFEHLEEIERKKMDILASRERYEKSLLDMEKELYKGREIQKNMVDRLNSTGWIVISKK